MINSRKFLGNRLKMKAKRKKEKKIPLLKDEF